MQKSHRSTSFISRVEPLENRIAPAGLVDVNYNPDTGELTLTGDALENDVRVFKTGENTHRIEGIATDIETAANATMDIGKLKRLTFVGGADDDTLIVSNLSTLKFFSFSGDAGSDEMTAINIKVNGVLELHGGAGSNEIFFEGLSTTIAGDVTVDAASGGADSIGVSFDAVTTVIEGGILFNGGGDEDVLVFTGSGAATIGAGINFNSGAGDGSIEVSNSGLFKVGRLGSGESILVTGGSGEDGLFANGAAIKLKGGIQLLGNAGDDFIDLSNDGLTVKIGKLASGESVVFDGGADGDSIATNVRSLTLKGGLEFAAGEGANYLEIDSSAGALSIGTLSGGRSILYSGGSGSDELSINEGNFILAGGIEMNAGAGSNDLDLSSFSGSGSIGMMESGRSIFMTGTTGSDSINTFARSLTFAGGIEFAAGDGGNSIGFEGGQGFLKVGKLSGGQSILYTGGSSNDELFTEPTQVKLAGGIEFSAGGGNNTLRFDNGGEVKVGTFGSGQSVVFTGTGNADNELDFGGFVKTKGSIELTGGTGSDDLDLDGNVQVGVNNAGLSLSLIGGEGDDDIDLSGNIILLGGLRLDGGNANDELDLNSHDSLTIQGAVEVIGGAGNDRFDLSGFGVFFGSTLTFTGGEGADFFYLEADGIIAGNVVVDHGLNTAGTQFTTFQSRTNLPGGLALNGTLSIDADSANVTADSLTILNVAVKKAIDIELGGGSSTVTINNLNANNTLRIDTRGGDDVVEIEREDFFGESVIKKLATILLGEGGDDLFIGTPATGANDPFPDSTRVNFIAGLVTDGGNGSDVRNSYETHNTFGVAITPPVNFELQLLD